MKKLIFAGMLLFVGSQLNAQQAADQEWFTPIIGGKNGYFIKHYFFSTELKKMLETSTGRGDNFDSVPMEIECAEPIIEAGVERYFPIYSGNYSVITFRNITENNAQVALCYAVFSSLEEAKAYIAPNDAFHLWHTKTGFEQEMAKPVIPKLNKSDVVDFFNYCKSLLDQAKADSPQLDKKALQSLYTQILIGAPMRYAREKGYNEFKSMQVIQKGVEENAQDADIKKIVETFKVQ